MKETTELFDSLFDTTAQAIESFADGFQFGTDLPAFLDEALSWPEAFRGVEKMKEEAKEASTASIELLFDRQQQKLTDVGLHPMLAGAITTNLKGAYYVFATIVQTGGNLVSS